MTAKSGGLQQLRTDWPVLTLYQRFESIVALVLAVIVSAVIVVALYRLMEVVFKGLVLGVLDPLQPEIFQTVFADVLTLLIALEFNHTLQYVVTRQESLIQTKVVLLIALLAMARKFIILDINATNGTQMLGLAAITLALGTVYWLMRERDDRGKS